MPSLNEMFIEACRLDHVSGTDIRFATRAGNDRLSPLYYPYGNSFH